MDEDGSKYVENIKIIEYNMDKIMDFWYNENEEKIKEYKYLMMLDVDRKSLSVLSKGDSFMEDYKEKIEKLNDNERFTSWITPEEDEKLILNTEKSISFDEGKRKKQLEIAKSLIAHNIDIHTISETTELSIDEVEQLKEEL